MRIITFMRSFLIDTHAFLKRRRCVASVDLKKY